MSDTHRSGGTGIGTILLVIFVVLKLTHMITWSWWWVLSPLLIQIALVILYVIITLYAESRKSPFEKAMDVYLKYLESKLREEE